MTEIICLHCDVIGEVQVVNYRGEVIRYSCRSCRGLGKLLIPIFIPFQFCVLPIQ